MQSLFTLNSSLLSLMFLFWKHFYKYAVNEIDMAHAWDVGYAWDNWLIFQKLFYF